MTPIVTYQEAIELGLKRYYSPDPCSRGHDSARFTSSRRCIECYYADRAKYYTKRPEVRLVHTLRLRAKQRGLPCTLTPEDIDLSGSCPICETQFIAIIHDRDQGKHFMNVDPATPTIDRVDPTLGYTKENTRVICAFCNNLKSNLTAYEARRRATTLLAIAEFIDRHQETARTPS